MDQADLAMSDRALIPSLIFRSAAILGLLAMLSPAPVHAQRPALPELIRAGGYDIILLSAKVARDLDDSDVRVESLVKGCRQLIRVPENDGAATVRVRPWPMRSARVQDESVLTIIVMPAEPVFVNCGDPVAQQVIAAARGVRITTDSRYDAARDVRRVVLRRGESELVPLESERHLIQRLTAFGLLANGSGLMRLALSIESVAPDTSGVIDDLRLQVWNGQDSIPTEIVLPWRSVAGAWQLFFGSRSARALADADTRALPMFLAPEPKDSVLRRARSRLVASEVRAGNALVAERLLSASLSPADLLNARMQLGVSLAQLGDSSASRVLLGLAVADEPCVTLPTAAPVDAQRLIGALRRGDALCAEPVLWRTAVRGALLPGFGSASTSSRRATGAVTFLAVTGGFALAAMNTSASRATYDEYLALDLPSALPIGPRATRIYDFAEKQRTTAILYMKVAGAIWAGSWAEAMLRDHRRRSLLASVKEYGTMRTGPSITPRGGPQGLGLSLNFF